MSSGENNNPNNLPSVLSSSLRTLSNQTNALNEVLKESDPDFWFDKAMERKSAEDWKLYDFYLRKAILIDPSHHQSLFQLCYSNAVLSKKTECIASIFYLAENVVGYYSTFEYRVSPRFHPNLNLNETEWSYILETVIEKSEELHFNNKINSGIVAFFKGDFTTAKKKLSSSEVWYQDKDKNLAYKFGGGSTLMIYVFSNVEEVFKKNDTPFNQSINRSENITEYFLFHKAPPKSFYFKQLDFIEANHLVMKCEFEKAFEKYFAAINHAKLPKNKCLIFIQLSNALYFYFGICSISKSGIELCENYWNRLNSIYHSLVKESRSKDINRVKESIKRLEPYCNFIVNKPLESDINALAFLDKYISMFPNSILGYKERAKLNEKLGNYEAVNFDKSRITKIKYHTYVDK